MTKLITENATIFQIDADLKPPKTDKEFLAHGLMQMIVELAPKAMLEFVDSNYNGWSWDNNHNLAINTAQMSHSYEEYVQKTIRPHYPQILGITPEIYSYIDDNIDFFINYGDDFGSANYGGISAMLDNMLVDAVFEIFAKILSCGLTLDEYDVDEFQLSTGCSGGQVCYLVAHTLIHSTNLSEIRPDGLSERDLEVVISNIRSRGDYFGLKPGDIEHLVENHAVEWLTNVDQVGQAQAKPLSTTPQWRGSQA